MVVHSDPISGRCPIFVVFNADAAAHLLLQKIAPLQTLTNQLHVALAKLFPNPKRITDETSSDDA